MNNRVRRYVRNELLGFTALKLRQHPAVYNCPVASNKLNRESAIQLVIDSCVQHPERLPRILRSIYWARRVRIGREKRGGNLISLSLLSEIKTADFGGKR